MSRMNLPYKNAATNSTLHESGTKDEFMPTGSPNSIKGQFIWFAPEISQIVKKKVDFNVTVYLVLVVFGTAQIGLLVTFTPCFNFVQFFEVIPVTDQTHIYLRLLE